MRHNAEVGIMTYFTDRLGHPADVGSWAPFDVRRDAAIRPKLNSGSGWPVLKDSIVLHNPSRKNANLLIYTDFLGAKRSSRRLHQPWRPMPLRWQASLSREGCRFRASAPPEPWNVQLHPTIIFATQCADSWLIAGNQRACDRSPFDWRLWCCGLAAW